MPEAANPSSPSIEHLLVQVLVRAVHEALLAGRGHESGHVPEAVALAFPPVWARLNEVHLRIDPYGIHWNEGTVLHGEDDPVGLARTLVASGIAALTLTPGVETEEIARFLAVVDRKIRLDEGDEVHLVTHLFREDFQHLGYSVGPAGSTAAVQTAPAETGPAVATSEADASAARVRRAVRADVEQPDRTRGVVQLEKFDSTLYFLDRNEIEYLRSAIDREYAQDHALSVIALLLDVLEQQKDVAVRSEVVATLGTLLPYLLGTGRFEAVAFLTAAVRELGRSGDLSDEHRTALDELRVSVSETRALAQLFHALDAGEIRSTPEDLGILLRELRPEAIQTVLVWVGQLERPEAKAALARAVEHFFEQWPNALTRMLSATDRTVVHRALSLARRLAVPELAAAVAERLRAEDVVTRRLSASALAEIGTAEALRLLVARIDDPDADVRRTVYAAFSARPFRGAEKRLAAALAARDLEERDVAERRALFEAFGAVAGPSGVAFLEPVLMGKGSLARRPSSETRACAAAALGVIGSPAARLALERAAGNRDPLVRSAAGSALRAE